MRHLKTGRKFGRTSATRAALFKNLSISLIEHEAIKTTLSKAKELRGHLEPLITLSKIDSVSNRRRAFSILRNKSAVGKLFAELGPRFKERPGGYLRIIKIGYRPGDSAPMALIEMVSKSEDSSLEEKVDSEKSA